MTTRGTIETISSGELSDTGRDFPHVLIEVPADKLPELSLGQVLHLVPADKVIQWRDSQRQSEFIELAHRLSALQDELAEVRNLVEDAIGGAE